MTRNSKASTFSQPAEGFNTAGLLLEGGGTQHFVRKDDLNALERVVHPDHAKKDEPTPAAEKEAKPMTIEELQKKLEAIPCKSQEQDQQRQQEQEQEQERTRAQKR